jgi:hypothetical protein
MLARNTSETTRRISPRWLLAAAAVVVVGFTVICGSVLMSMRRGDEKLAHQTLGNLASSIDADVARNVELYDLSLRNVVGNMTEPELVEISRPMRQLILFDHAATARHFGAIQVTDVVGNVTLDSSTLDPKPQNFADEEFFKVHKRDPLFGLYISKPMLHQGSYGIVLSRRIAARDGTFLGIVAGFIRYSVFPRDGRSLAARTRTTSFHGPAAGWRHRSCARRSTWTMIGRDRQQNARRAEGPGLFLRLLCGARVQ